MKEKIADGLYEWHGISVISSALVDILTASTCSLFLVFFSFLFSTMPSSKYSGKVENKLLNKDSK